MRECRICLQTYYGYVDDEICYSCELSLLDEPTHETATVKERLESLTLTELVCLRDEWLNEWENEEKRGRSQELSHIIDTANDLIVRRGGESR